MNKTVPVQNCSWPILNFTSEEFKILPNGSVHLLSSNVSCPAEQVGFQNCSRPILNFTSEEFDILRNGSVYLLSSNLSCPAEQVVIQDTTALICGDCLLEYFSKDAPGGQTTGDADQSWLTLGLVIVSDVAVFGFVVHTFRSGEWKKGPAKLKVIMMTSITVAESMFVGRGIVPAGPGCAAYAMILHYLMLTAFTSMNALSVDLFLTFRQGSERPELSKYVLYILVAPLPVVVATVIVEFGSSVRVGYGESCWIGNPTASLVAFGVPVLCALMINAVFITLALLTIRKSFQIASTALKRSDLSKAWVYMRISFLTGFTWILGFIFPFAQSTALEYIFIVLNASQGLLLTLFLTMTSKVVEKWKSVIMARLGLAEPQQDNGTTVTDRSRRTTGRGAQSTAGGTVPIVEISMTTFPDVNNRARLHLGEPRQGSSLTGNANKQLTSGEGTELTAGGTISSTDMALTILADVEENRAPLDEALQDSGQTATASKQQTTADGIEVTADGTGTATDMPMIIKADVEENEAALQLGESHQDSGQTATAHKQMTTADGFKVTAGGTGSATDMPVTRKADVEDNRAPIKLDEARQDSGQTGNANKQLTTAGGTEVTAEGTDPNTDTAVSTSADVRVDENCAPLQLDEARQDNGRTATVGSLQTTAGGTEEMADETDTAGNAQNVPRGVGETTSGPDAAADIHMKTFVDVEENKTEDSR
ncbi:ADGRL1 [Branchiostoma lanceolatum]|uniref:ADGRL1 protein n=1 Tax=Branchiostoma lanceolatum TaxID=7740 RepID=A0A8J9Z7Z9_BRALA|nr:ADGRL1 [Branchiostoma lanceolatum]